MIASGIKSRINTSFVFALLLIIAFVGGAIAFEPSYFANSNVIIGFCLLPFSLVINGPRRNNFIFIALASLFGAMAFTYQVRIFYFFTLAFYLLWIGEMFMGKLNIMILFLIVFMSPFFVQVVTILGFPMRLLLSAYAGALLKSVGVKVLVEGNVMIVDGAMFSVDEACMGLHMLAISMLIGVFVLAFRYRVSGSTLNMFPTISFFTITFLLNIITNLIRIIVLVYFKILPENPMHEIVGILCLVVYVLIPLHFFSAFFVRKYGKQKIDIECQASSTRSSIFGVIILPLIVLSVGATLHPDQRGSNTNHANVSFRAVTFEKMEDGISKLETDSLLIYAKAIPEFFTGEHTPLMCWKGSGYDFSGIRTLNVRGHDIYTGTLVKNSSMLYTAWWYSNGETETISQFDWRVRMLKGEPDFCLINVTAENEKILTESVTSIFTNNEIVIKN